VAATAQELIDYYTNLLIIQYNGKERSRAHVANLVREAVANGIYFEVQDAYALETAIGVQLDVVGIYQDVDRLYTTNEFLDDYFGFEDAADIGNLVNSIIGLDDAASPDKEGVFFDASEVIVNNFQLNDDAFRVLIKLRIAQNYGNHSAKEITESLELFSGNEIIFIDNYDMSITYLVGDSSTALVKAALQKNVFPKPAGVRLEAISGNLFFGFYDAANLSAAPDYIAGFNDAVAGFIKTGRLLDANNDIIS
jgi:hypothetical protein